MYILLNSHSMMKTDDSVFKEPIALQVAFRITLGHKMSHEYMNAQFVLGIREVVVTTEVKPATCIQEYYTTIKIWG